VAGSVFGTRTHLQIKSTIVHRSSVVVRSECEHRGTKFASAALRPHCHLKLGRTLMQEKKTEKKASETIRDTGENAREAASRLQESTSRAAEGFRDYQLRLISAAQDHANALFEYAQDVVRAQSITELVEVSTSHTRRQFEMMTEESRELAA